MEQLAANHYWDVFSIIDERNEPLEDGRDEQVSCPPSEEAMTHLDEAIKKAGKLIDDIRRTAGLLMKANVHGNSNATVITQVGLAMEKADAIDKQLSHLRTLGTTKLLSTTDAALKAALHLFAPLFLDGQKVQQGLFAMTKDPKKQTGKSGKDS